MRRIIWPEGLRPIRVTPVGGPQSMGFTESVTAEIQTVMQPYSRTRYQFEFGPLRGRAAAELTGMIAALEDGANWVSVPYLYGNGPGYADMGIWPPQDYIPWDNGQPFEDSGAYWEPSRPHATVQSGGAIGGRFVAIDVTNWGGAMWPGILLGFVGNNHLTAYMVQEVVGTTGNVRTVRVTPPLRKAVTAGDIVTPNPVQAMTLAPKTQSAGTRYGRHIEGAAFQMSEVLPETIEVYTE